MVVKIRKARPEDAAVVAAGLRQSDTVELAAEHGLGLSSLEAVSRSLAVSEMAWTALLDGKPFCVFGVSTVDTEVGSPWLLATDAFAAVPVKTILRQNRKYVKIMLHKYKYLYNFVYHKNEISIKWLKMIGFRVHDSIIPFSRGLYGGKFYLFDLVRSEFK